jgi:hypothetical protein
MEEHMKKNIVLFTVICAILLSVGAASAVWAQGPGEADGQRGPRDFNDPHRNDDFRRAAESIQRIKANLQTIEDSYIKTLDFNQRREAIRRVDEINAMLDNLGMPERPVAVIAVIPDNDFGQMMQAMNRTAFYNQKKDIFTAYSRKYFFTANQIRQILATLSFSNDKADFFKYSSAFVSTREELVSLVQGTETEVIGR